MQVGDGARHGNLLTENQSAGTVGRYESDSYGEPHRRDASSSVPRPAAVNARHVRARTLVTGRRLAATLMGNRMKLRRARPEPLT